MTTQPTVDVTGLNGNANWLRERAAGILRKDRPQTESEWKAFAEGMLMIAEDWEKTQAMILNAIAQSDGAVE